MLQENEGTISTQDQPTGSDIFVSVEMSRSKWMVGIHTPLADKIGLHTMACGDVEALLALIDRARVKLVASGSNSPAAMICYEAGYEAKEECVMVGDIDDHAIALGLDPKFVVVKVHRPRIELVPLRYIWRMESMLGVAAGHRDRRNKMLRVEPFV